MQTENFQFESVCSVVVVEDDGQEGDSEERHREVEARGGGGGGFGGRKELGFRSFDSFDHSGVEWLSRAKVIY